MDGLRFQPQGGARLDRCNPLTRGISDVWVASSLATLVRKFPATRAGYNGSPETVIDAFGPAGKFVRGDGVTKYAGIQLASNSNDLIGPTTTWFIVRRCRDTVVRGTYMHYGYDKSGLNRCLLGAPEGSNITWDYGNAMGGSGRLQAPYTKDTMLETLVVVAGQVKGREIWRRGVKIASDPSAKYQRASDTAPFGIGAIGDGILLGGNGGGNTEFDDVENYMFGVSNREWSDAEIVRWSRNPWQIFEDTHADDAAIAASYLTSIQPGSLALAGAQIATRTGRRLAVQPAALVATGMQVALRSSRTMAVSPSMLAVGAGGIAVRAARQLAASPAAMALSGGQVSRQVARRLAVAPSAMAVADGQVSTRVSRGLIVTPAAMAMSGSQVGLQYVPKPVLGAYALAVSSSAISLAGGVVGVRAARRLSAGASSMTMGQGAVAIRAGKRVAVSPLPLSIACPAAAMRAARRISTAPVSIGLTGGTVDMQYSPTPKPGAYSLAISSAAGSLFGGSVGMRAWRRMGVAPAGMAISAGAALVLVGRSMAISPRGFGLGVGSMQVLLRRRMPVSPFGAKLLPEDVLIRYSEMREPFDISKIDPSTLVVFDGSGSRITKFDGSGSRIALFDSSGNRITRF